MLPEIIRPMEPTLARSVRDDPDWLYQVKWDGVRMLAYISNEAVRLLNRRHNPRTSTYPEIVTALKDMVPGNTVLDGEIVVIKHGRPEFREVMRRDAATRPRAELLATLPTVYVVFDLLHLGGDSLLDVPLAQRLSLLRTVISPGHTITVTDDYDSGEALMEVMVEREWEGIVAKRRNSPYRSGKHSDWKKVKISHVKVFPVIGWTERDGRPRALLLGVPGSDGGVAGRVASGLSAAEWAQAITALSESPGRTVASHPRGELWFTVSSDLYAVVEFQQWSPDRGIRAPVLKSLLRGPRNGGDDHEGRAVSGDRWSRTGLTQS